MPVDESKDSALKNFCDLFFKEDGYGKIVEEKEFIYRPENLEKQLEALDNMDEDFKKCAIDKVYDYTGKRIFEFMEDEKCFGDELKKKIAQKRFIELYCVYEFKPEVFDLVFDKENLANFNDYDIDVLQKLHNDGGSNSECGRLLNGHKLFILNNDHKSILQKLGINIFFDNNIDIAKEISTTKDKIQVIYNSMYKNTDEVSAGGCYAKAALQAYKKQGTIDWNLSENKKELQDFIGESKANTSENGFWGYGDKAMEFLSKKYDTTTVYLGFTKFKDLNIQKYDTNGDEVNCGNFEELKDIAYAILDDCPTIMHNYSADHFQNLSCNNGKRKQFVYDMFNLYMNERMKEIYQGDGFGLQYILGFFGIDDDDKQENLTQKFESVFNELKINNIDIKLYSIFKLYRFLVSKFVEYFIDHREINENKSSFDFFCDVFEDIKKEIIDYVKPYSDLIKKFYSKDANGEYNTQNQLEMLKTMDFNSKQLLKSNDLCTANEFNLEVQKKLFDDDIFLYGEFPNFGEEMQIYVLENLNPRKKRELKSAFEKNSLLFSECSHEVKEKLIKLCIIFDEKINDNKKPDNKKINEQSLNEFENYLSDFKSDFPDILKDYEEKLADIKIPEKLDINIRDFSDEINKLKNEIDEKIKLAKQKKLVEEKKKAEKENENNKKNDLNLIKKCALVIASVLGNQKACEIIGKLTDDELNNFYNENKNILKKIKAELCKKENIRAFGLKEKDFLSNDFKLDDEKIKDIANKFNIPRIKSWFVGLGTAEVVSVVLEISMIFLELPILAIGTSPIVIGFLVALIYKLVKQVKINTSQKKILRNIGIRKNDLSKVINKLDDWQKNKIPNR